MCEETTRLDKEDRYYKVSHNVKKNGVTSSGRQHV